MVTSAAKLKFNHTIFLCIKLPKNGVDYIIIGRALVVVVSTAYNEWPNISCYEQYDIDLCH